MDTYRYRPNVAAILEREEGSILICERLDVPGSWQFPQGGVDAGETREQALRRELREELSLEPSDFEIVEMRGPYRYLLGRGRTKKGYDGQEQHYFLARFVGEDRRINVRTPHQEFRSARWIRPEGFDFRWVPDFKRDVYRAVFRDFFGIGSAAGVRERV